MSQGKPTEIEINTYAGNWVEHGDQTKAWRVTYPNSKAQEEVKHTKASAMHKMAQVQLRIYEIKEIRRKAADTEHGLTAKWVAERLKAMAELDILDIMTDDLKNFKLLSEWPKIWRTSISGLDLMVMSSKEDDQDIESIIKKIKWPDKTKNLELIGKLVEVSAFSDNLNITKPKEPSPINSEEYTKLRKDMIADDDC